MKNEAKMALNQIKFKFDLARFMQQTKRIDDSFMMMQRAVKTNKKA